MSASSNFGIDLKKLPSGKKYRIGIVIAKWNEAITGKLYDGAYSLLVAAGVKNNNIETLHVPGTFELGLGCQWLAQKEEVDAVIALGCVIKGETPHFEYICQAASTGIMAVGLKYNKPVIFGVLTTLNDEQAQDRVGGKHGNKGMEAAFTALNMLQNKK